MEYLGNRVSEQAAGFNVLKQREGVGRWGRSDGTDGI